MGMYSFVVGGELEIREGCEKAFLKWCAEAEENFDRTIPKNYKPRFDGKLDNIKGEYCFWFKSIKESYQKNEPLEDIFAEKKIIGYWYEGFCIFLRDVAQFIEGDVLLSYETDEERCEICFEDGEVNLKFAELVWGEFSALDEVVNVPELSDDEKLLRRL